MVLEVTRRVQRIGLTALGLLLGSLPPAMANPACVLAEPSARIALERPISFKVTGLKCPKGGPSKALLLQGMDTEVRSIGCDETQGLVTFYLPRGRSSGASTAKD